MPTSTETKSAEDLLFSRYLPTGLRLSGEAAQAFLETKAREVAHASEQKSAESLLFAHYLRTGERLYGEAATRFVEQKFNQRHLRENGQFARAGEGVHYGGFADRAGPATRARQSNTSAPNSRTTLPRGTSRNAPNVNRDIVVIGDRDKPFREDFDATFPQTNRVRRRAQTNPRSASEPTLRPTNSHQLGDLSAGEESGPSPMPGLVSSGRGDHGGVSYGPWQLATNRRQPQAFLASEEGQRWAHRFVGKAPGSEDFSRTWRDVARQDGLAFFHAQRRYIGQSHYEEGLQTIRNDTRIDLSRSGRTLQDVIWSRSVQLGPKTGAFKKAVELADRQLNGVNRDSYEWSSQFIKNVYAESGRRDSEGKMVYFTRSPTLWPNLSRRFVREERAAQAMLSREWGRN